MGEKLFRFNTNELRFIRIACQKNGCGAVTELPIARLELGGHPHCAVCQEPFFDPGSSILQHFAHSIGRMNDLKSKVKFEFTIPVVE